MRFYRLERDYLELVYNGTNDSKNIAEILNTTKTKVAAMKKSIFKKLSANTWYNAIRKSFELNILDKNKYRSLDFEFEVNKTVKSIRKIDFSKNNSDVKVKLAIYYELTKLYNKLEYDILLNNQLEKNKQLVLSNKVAHKKVS